MMSSFFQNDGGVFTPVWYILVQYWNWCHTVGTGRYVWRIGIFEKSKHARSRKKKQTKKLQTTKQATQQLQTATSYQRKY